MQNQFDFVLVGYGPVIRSFVALNKNSSILVVSDQEKNSISCSDKMRVLSYRECATLSKKISTKSLIISTNFEVPVEAHVKFQFLLEIVRSVRSERITYLSSASVYSSSFVPATESSATNANSDYAQSKIHIETALKEITDSKELQILRISNLFGSPGISKLFDNLERAICNHEILALPRREHFRDFVYLQDLMTYISNSQNYQYYPVVNFSSGYSHEISQALDLYCSSFNFTVNSQRLNSESVPRISFLSNDLLVREIGFRPRGLVEGLTHLKTSLTSSLFKLK